MKYKKGEMIYIIIDDYFSFCIKKAKIMGYNQGYYEVLYDNYETMYVLVSGIFKIKKEAIKIKNELKIKWKAYKIFEIKYVAKPTQDYTEII